MVKAGGGRVEAVGAKAPAAGAAAADISAPPPAAADAASGFVAAAPSGAHAGLQPPRLRIDKWLWQARFFKTRSLAAALAQSGHLRVNSQPIHRASREVGPGDVLTFPQGRMIRLIRIVGTGVRRGPACEAQSLFIDLDAPASPTERLE